jgi:aldehyde dehydrogenase (NAD+)
MTLRLQHLIGGRLADGGPVNQILSASDLTDCVALAPEGGAAEINAAVAAAVAAFPTWSGLTGEARADMLDRVGRSLIDRQAELGRLLAREEGKTLREATGEVVRAGRIFCYQAGEAIRLHGQTIGSVRPGVDTRTWRRPVGVFGLITPWNFPIAIPAWKAAAALAAGNCVVLKPADATPAIASALAAIVMDAGVPPGVFNIVLGGAAAGAALAAHPQVDGVSFTGSQSIGRQIAVVCAGRHARCQLEMGGKNALVVLDDADLPRAVSVALDGAYFSTGQRCTASSRLIVTDNIHDRFVAALAERVHALKVGHALHPDTEIGPAAGAAHAARIREHMDRALADGAVLAAQATVPAGLPEGHYIAPALLASTHPDMAINHFEVFGPLATVIRVRDLEQAIEVMNGTAFGLSAGIMTASLDSARAFESRARAGLVMINLPTAGVDYHLPFGGTRGSSVGPREQGYAAMDFYTETRTIYVG